MKSFAIVAALLCASASSALAAPAEAGNNLEARWGKPKPKPKKSWHPKKGSKPWKKAQTITKVVIVYKPTTVVEHGKTRTKTITSTCTQEQVTTVTDPGQTITGTVTATTTLSIGQNFTLTSVVTATATAPSTNRVFQQNFYPQGATGPQAMQPVTLYALNSAGGYVVDKTATTATLFNTAGLDVIPGNSSSVQGNQAAGRSPTGPCFWITDPAYASSGGQNAGSPVDQCVLGYATNVFYSNYTDANNNVYQYSPLVPACYTRGYGFTANVAPLLFCNSATVQASGSKNTGTTTMNFVQAESGFGQLVDLFQPTNGTGPIIVGYTQGSYQSGPTAQTYSSLDANAPTGYVLDTPSI